MECRDYGDVVHDEFLNSRIFLDVCKYVYIQVWKHMYIYTRMCLYDCVFIDIYVIT